MAEPVVSGPGDGERFERDNRTIAIRVDLPGLSINEIEFDDTFEVPPHEHDDHVDAFYVLEGQVEFRAGDEPHVAGPGTFFAAPRNTVHGFRNADAEPIRLLNLHAPPAGFVDRLRQHG